MSGEEITEPIWLGIDVGGTNTKLGLVDDGARVLGKHRIPTKPTDGPDVALDRLRTAVDELFARQPFGLERVTAVGLATPGTMDIPAGLLLDPPNLPGWQDYPVRQEVEGRLGGLPTYLQNDANAAAYGEFWAGAGKDAHSLVLWTLGTGIGCGIVIEGVILAGRHSHGSECGHIVIDYDGRFLPGTGQYGTLEAYAGANAVVARCREAIETGRDSSLRARLDAGETLTPLMIAEAAEAGDELADEIVMDTARYLGIGTTSVMHTIDPDMFLYGGAMTFGRHEKELGRRFLARIKEEVGRRGFPLPYSKIEFEYATLGNDAGFIGAAGYARHEHAAR